MSQAMQMVQITVIGRLVANPTQERQINGRNVTNFRIITSKKVGNKDEIVTFECGAWNNLSTIAQNLSKGRLVTVTSNELTQEIWKANGKEGINNKLIINSLVMLDHKPQDGIQNRPAQPTNKSHAFNAEEIPF